jgi:hypothetical protein
MMHRIALLLLALSVGACAGPQTRDDTQTESYAPPPPSILTPDRVDTRLGPLEFFDGLPSAETVRTVYDNLDFQRAVRAFLDGIPGASMQAIKRGMEEAGALPNYTVLLSESRLDAHASFLTTNSESVYAFVWLSLKGGPIAVVTPPQVSGLFTDAWQRHIGYAGQAGPDGGKGGLYVVVPPGYTGYVPRTKYAIRSRTFGVWAAFRAPMVEGTTKWAVRNFKERLKGYPLKEAKRPPPNQFVDISGMPVQTIPPDDFGLFELIDALVQEEPNASQDPELLGVLAAIGIEKGRKFEPDARMKAILEEAAMVGSATARALLFRSRLDNTLSSGSQWRRLSGGEDESGDEAFPRLDARIAFSYYATEPAAPAATGERGFVRAAVFSDASGQSLDGAKTYALTLPANPPAASWSVVAYDNQTRSMLQTDQRFPSLSNERRVPLEEDGSITLYFGPKPPRKERASWIQTVPGKGFSVVLRLDRPRGPWFDGRWRPGNLERLEEVPRAPLRESKPRMATELSSSIGVPDRLATRLGMLELVDGVPTQRTARLLYENLDFMRGVEAFLTTLSGASLVAIRRGLGRVGVDRNAVVGIFDQNMDAHSLFLTPSPDDIYLATWLDLREGAMIVESPSNTLGILDDFFFRKVAELGKAGPDRGRGGLFLFVPESYEGQLSERYFAHRSPTYGNLLAWRTPAVDGDPASVAERIRKTLQVYPFDVDFEEDVGVDAEEETTEFISLSGKSMNTIQANDFGFYEDVAALIREEPSAAFDEELLGLLAAIGIEKTRPFSPDQPTRDLLTETASVANATARALAFRPRDPAAPLYDASGWYAPLPGESDDFLRQGARQLDSRTMFFYLTTMTSRGSSDERTRARPEYALCASDSEGRYLDGSRSYRLILPKSVPVNDHWSLVVYDPQTRSMLQAPRSALPAVSSRRGAVPSEDGRIEVFFGPRPPPGAQKNWVQTVPGKGWFAMLRLHEALDPWFDQSWRPGEIERLE